jgi:hypothetical protein
MLHHVWRTARGPFHRVTCKEHTWEVYGGHNAGCLKCGCEHVCSKHVFEKTCPLAATQDGGVCCTITGYCVPTLRLSDAEYVESVHFEKQCKSNAQQVLGVEDINALVQWFLVGHESLKCKKDEIDKAIAKYHVAFVKVLKQRKVVKGAKDNPRCILSALALVLDSSKPKYMRRASPKLCEFCSLHIFKCLKGLNLANVYNRRLNLVIGMLYLMKQGLVIQNVQWLPKIPELSHCLPHETTLEKNFKLCMKLVCETENEIKLALRQRVNLT